VTPTPFSLSRTTTLRGLCLGVVLLTLVTTSCVHEFPSPHGTFGHGTLLIIAERPVRLTVRIAATQQAQRQGLMGETRLAESAGMAFTYQGPTDAPFWMKDTQIPLSIAFWNEHHRIVDMLDMDPCTSDPCPLYRSRSPFLGAVEVNEGFFDHNGVHIGDTVRLDVQPTL
jgi:uncharacterized protein